ncbi:FecR family protein [Oceanibacterium hippocampi]|nr:FecR domain-containing protein [Oceanibacterium hippocampi]
MVKVWAYGTPPTEARRDLYKPDSVDQDEVVETVTSGALHMEFLDQSVLRLGSASTVKLDEFVYNPATTDGQMAVNLSKGVFRFVTGKMTKSGISFTTPSATIGVRGTDFIATVDAAGNTTISVLEGAVDVTPAAGGPGISVAAGQSVTVAMGASSGQIGQAFRNPDVGLDDAGSTPGNDGGENDLGSSSSSEE